MFLRQEARLTAEAARVSGRVICLKRVGKAQNSHYRESGSKRAREPRWKIGSIEVPLEAGDGGSILMAVCPIV